VKNFFIHNYGAAGIYVEGSWNTITQNIIRGNNAGVFVLGNNNSITRNYVVGDYLVHLNGDYNLIYLNNFEGSIWLVNPPGTGNQFDNGP
jgi:parallel beta-helix repeat protein